MTIIHISSIERAQVLLTIDGLNAATFEEENYLYRASSKVSVVIDGAEKAGYVLSSNEEVMKIQLVDNSIIECAPPQWNEDANEYDYVEGANCAPWIKQFTPIRFSVQSSGEVKITLHRFCVRADNNHYFYHGSS